MCAQDLRRHIGQGHTFSGSATLRTAVSAEVSLDTQSAPSTTAAWSERRPLAVIRSRRTDVVGIFPDRTSIIRLVGAVLAEQHDEWAEGRRYLGLDVLARAQAVNTTEEVPTDLPLQAITARATRPTEG